MDTCANTPNLELIARAKAGDTRAAELFLKTQRPHILESVKKKVTDPRDAEDITQETLIQIWKGLPKFNGDKLSVWVYQITRKTTSQWFQKRSH